MTGALLSPAPAALLEPDPDAKCAAATVLVDRWRGGMVLDRTVDLPAVTDPAAGSREEEAEEPDALTAGETDEGTPAREGEVSVDPEGDAPEATTTTTDGESTPPAESTPVASTPDPDDN